MSYVVIGTDGREYGPVSAEQVRQWLAERRLHSMSLARLEGALEWKPLSMLPEFQGVPPALAPPAVPPTVQGTRPSPRTNLMALLGFIMGLLAVVTACCFCCSGFPFNILGIIFSAVGLAQIKRQPDLETGRGLAWAGLVLSLLGAVLSLLAILGFGLATFLSAVAQSSR
jgi:hypothetical protein